MSLHPSYFHVHFRTEPPDSGWPVHFILVTGYATTGEAWPAERNAAANAALLATLEQLGVWHHPITGYHPETLHAEPGYAVAVPLPRGVSLGREFLQDAIYRIDGDVLSVVSCVNGEEATVGAFRERIAAA